MGVSTRSTERAARLLGQASDELIAAVEQGEVPLFHAEEVLGLPKGKQCQAARKLARDKERAALAAKYRPKHEGDLRGFTLRFGQGSDDPREEAEHVRHIAAAARSCAKALLTVRAGWLSRARLEMAHLVPPLEEAVRAARATQDSVAALLEAVEKLAGPRAGEDAT